MKERIISTFLIVSLFSIYVIAQQPEDCGIPSPPGADDCEDACVYCDLTANGYNGSTIGYSADPPAGFCGTIENNQWFAFAAGTTTVEFTIVPSNCQFNDGVQGAIYESCAAGTQPIVCEGGNNNGGNTTIVVTATNLVVGQIYWFMVDGYAGDECDYNVTVTDGNTDPPPLDPPGPIDGVTIGCASQTVTFTVPPLPGASYYEWTLPDGSTVTTEDPFIDYTFGPGGQVCVQANNVCNFSTQICIPITVLAPDAGTLTLPPPLCPNETANISVTGFNTDPALTQVILITDASGSIIEIINGSTGTFTHDACDDFQVCTYNYVTAEVTPPVIGDNVNNIDCTTDCCDISCQNLSFQDLVVPTFPNAPFDLTLNCFDEIPPMEDQEWADNCDGTGMVAGVESGNADLCNGGTLTRTWEYTDVCGNLGAHQQTISVDPPPPADFVNPPANVTVDCDNIPASGEVLTYTNNGVGACLITGTVIPLESGSADVCGGTIIYTWEYTDQCGRLISHIQNVTVLPAQPATFINAPPDMTVDCNNIPTSGQDLTYTNGGFGACLIDGSVPPVESGSADICGGTITYTWTFTDPCGVTINHVQNITVTPAPIPAFINLPANMTVTCDNVPTGAPDLTYTNNATGACLIEGTIQAVESGNIDICGGEIRYTWEFTDPCGNNISHAQIITVEPAPAPSFVNPPADMLVNCDAIPTGAPDLFFTNNGLGGCLIEGMVPAVESGSGDICGGTITYTWDFTDQCGNNIIHVQNITIQPAPDIAFVNPPGDLNATCANVSNGIQDLQYTNNASGACLIEGTVQPIQGGSYDACGGTITNTWTFTTDCGQTINHVQSINIDPAPQASFIGNLPQNTTFACNAVPNGAPSLDYSNNESGICLISGSVPAQQTGNYNECGGTLVNSWIFTDACGRTIQHQQTITVEPAPMATFMNPPGPTTLACSDIAPSPPNLNYNNNSPGACSIAGNVQAIQSGSFDACGGLITYTWTFTDDCNRTISHTQDITVLPAADPVFTNPPADLTIDCGASFPTPIDLPYTNNEFGNCANTGSVPAQVTIITDLIQEYTWTFVNPCNGATITHTQVVTQNQAPDITVDPLFFDLCQGEPFDLSTLVVTDLNGTNPTITYHSATPANLGNQIPSPIVSPTVSTTYYILATNGNGCTDEASFQILIEVPPFAGDNGVGFVCFADPFGINLFDYLSGNPAQTGQWQSLEGVDVSNPYSVSLFNYPAGSYTFTYEVTALGVCPNSTATVTLELLPEILLDVLDITCSDDPDFYEVSINTNGFNIFYNAGTLTDLGSNQVVISDIPIGVTLVINASNPTQLQCLLDIVVSPPDCDCDVVEPPVSDGDQSICVGEPTPELSVTVGPGETANWYDAPNGGTLLLGGSTTYTPTVTAPGVYQYYVDAENIADGCLSLIRTLVQLEIIATPEGNDAQLEACDDDDDGFVEFDLTEANAQISSNVTFTYTYYETLMDAEDEMNAVSSPYTNTSTPTQDLFVVVNSPEGCTDIVTLTLLVNPLPLIDLEITNEACLGDGNGSVIINSATGGNYSLDGSNWTMTNTFEDLASGTYTAYVEDANLCVSSLDFMIEPGLELTLVSFESVCDNNGTATDPSDDFYTITFTVGNTLSIAGTFTINDGTTDLGTFNYDESSTLMIPANDQSLTLTFTDDILACTLDQALGPLVPCSSDCLISLDQLDFVCTDNGTPADPSDDFYTITINASAVNGSANNTYNVLIDAIVSYNFPYGDVSTFTLPANGTSPSITVADNQFAGCEVSQDIGPLVTCSDDCILNGVATIIACNDEDTGSNPLDDTYTFELLVTGQNLSAGWQTDDGLYTGNYDESQTLGPFLISEGPITLTILDNINQSCAIDVTATPPATCSSCGQTVDAGAGATLTCMEEEAILTGMASESGSYSWTGPGTFAESTLSVTVSDPGWYFFNVDFAGSCSAMDSVLVEMNNEFPTADAGPDQILGCTDLEADLSGSGSASSGGLTYEWFDTTNSLGAGQVVTVTGPGVYIFVVTNTLNGCSVSDEVEIFENNVAPEAIVLEPDSLDCEIDEVTLDGSTSTGIGALSYEWQNSDGDVIAMTATTLVNTAGNYLLRITDADNDCTDTVPVEVLENMDAPTAMATVDNELSCTNLTVILDGTSSTGTGILNYEWFNGSNFSIGTTAEVSTAETGTYTLIVTNPESHCADEITIEVLGDTELPIADAGPATTLTCDVTSALLDAGASSITNGILSYQWTDSNDDIIAETDTIGVNQPGIYTILVIAANGCTDEATVEILASADVPFADAGPDGVLGCDIVEFELGTTATTTGPMITYQWLDENNEVIGVDPFLTVMTGGVFTLEVLNTGNNCLTSDEVTILENNIIPLADAGPGGTLDCDSISITLGGPNTTPVGAGITYEWQNSNGDVLGMTPEIVVTTADTYTLFVVNTENDCEDNSMAIVIGDALAPVADAGPATTLDCQVMTALLDASASTGGNSMAFEWTDPNGDVIAETDTIQVSQPGIYTIQVSTANGCVDEATVEILASADVPFADAGPDAVLDCMTDQIMIGTSNTSTGATITYLWLDENNEVVGVDPFLNIISSGTYTLEVSNSANNCASSDVVEIMESATLPAVDPGENGVLTCDSTSVMLGGTGTANGMGITYEWQNSNGDVVGMTPTIIVEAVDIYTLFVFNANNNCDNNASVEVTGDALAPIADAGPSTTLDCQVMMATLDAGGSAGANTLTFEWTDSNGDVIAETETTQVSQPGIYMVQVETANGCIDEATVEIFASADVPFADAGPDGILDCNTNQIMIGTSNTSTGTTITYQWLDENNEVLGVDPFLSVMTNGVYTLEVSNSANNCLSSDVVEITDDFLNPTVDPGLGGTLTCDLTMISLGGTATSSGTDISYEWQNSNGDVVGMTPTITVSDADEYTLYVFNAANGCNENAMVEVFENTLEPIADAGLNQELNCEDPTAILYGSNSSGNNLSFEWLNPTMDSIGESPTLEVTENGTYTLIITDMDNGCTDQSTVEVSSDNNIPEAIPLAQSLLTCTNLSVVLDGSLSTGSNGTLLYQWLDDQNMVIATTVSTEVTMPGFYTLMVTDLNNGCDHSATVEVIQNTTTPMADAGNDQILTCDVTQVTLYGTASNGNNFSFEWFDDNMVPIGMTSDVTVASTGIYQLQVTNTENGCTAISFVEVIPDDNIPVAEAGPAGLLTCDVLEVTLNGTGSETGSDIQYEWQDANGQMLGDELTLIVTEPGFYTLLVTDVDNSCVTEDNVFVDQNIVDPIAAIDPIGALDCNEQSLVLNGAGSFPAGNLSFEWSTTDGNIASGTNAPNPEIDEPGTYTLTVIDLQNGCENSTAISVDQNIEAPQILINTPELLNCLITQTVINAGNSSNNGNFVYQWIANPVGGLIAGETTLMPTVDAPGTYTLTILNEDNGCTSTESVTVDEDITNPVASASVDDDLDCVTTSIQLSGTGSSTGANYTYLWNGPSILSGSTSLAPTINSGGIYSLLVTDTENGCTEIADLLVTENANVPNGLNVLIDPPLCAGDRGSITIQSVQGGAAPYLYSFDDGQSFYAFSVFNNLEPGSYTILVQDAIGCEYEESIFIPGVPELIVDLGPEFLIVELGSNMQLNAAVNIPNASIASIVWSPMTNLSCTDCLNPIVTPLNETRYKVTVTDLNGCTAQDDILLRVDKDRAVFIPNVFSPHNQDGINDGFMIFADLDQIETVNSFQVYDRWGEKVFEDYDFLPNDPAHSWDGYLRGEPMNPAVFVYWAEITFVDGVKKLYKGDVTIVR